MLFTLGAVFVFIKNYFFDKFSDWKPAK